MLTFENQVVLVTGAGRPYGRAVALAFARLGARLAVQDISPVILDQTVALIREQGGEARAYLGDMVKKISAQVIINQVTDDFGSVNILVNAFEARTRFSVMDMDEWDWHRTLDVNLTAYFLAMQSMGRVMRAQGGGAVVNLHPLLHQLSGYGACAAAHGGLLALTEVAAQEFASDGVRVNAVFPQETDQPNEALVDLAVKLVLKFCDPHSKQTGQLANV